MTIILNEGFEDGQWTHNVKVFPVDADPYGTEIGNIFTPKDWLFWFKHEPDTWDQPEARHCWKSADPHRVKEGEGSHIFFSFWRHHDAGYMRSFVVEPGTSLRLTAWAHAWSNHSLPGHEDCLDDGRCSCGVGRQVIAIAAEDIPPLNGDPWNDAIGNSMFTIGIDPYGGEDPYSPNVVWGKPYAIYNGYAHQLVVEAKAGAERITIFLRNVTLWPFKHNDAYWDVVKLESADTPPPPPPPPYESTMLVLPQDATPEQLHEVFTLAFPGRHTIGFSHDDAGHLNGTAILYNIPDDKVDDYIDFYTERYPNVIVQFAYTSDWQEPSELLLWQCDPAWGSEEIAGPDCSLTLCQTGCWVSCCAIAQRLYDIKPDATPSTANQALGAVGGFDGCYTTWAGMKEALGLEVVKRSYDDVEAQEWLDTGDILFAEVEPEDFTHFVMVTRYSEGRFWMLDPYKNVEGWVDEYYPGVESWRLIRPFEASPPPPPPDSVTLVGLHLQTMVPGALEYIRAAKPRVAKIFQLENAQAIKAASPNTLVVLRYYTPDQNMSGDLAQRAREYVATFESSLRVNAEWIDYVESYNETIPSDNESVIRRSVEFDCCFADALMTLGLPVRPVLLNVAVGNPFESEVELLLPAVRKIVEYDGAAGYHGYGLAVAPDGDLNDAWQYYAGRALESWDPVFRAYGLYPDYFLGEAGVFATCGDGWRSSKCLDGDWGRYLEQLKEFQSRLRSWNVAHGYRCLGAVLFTSGAAYTGWESFQITQLEMKDMAITL